MNKSFTRRAAAVAGVAGAVVMSVTSLGAGSAAANGSVTKTLVDGTPVTIQVFDEKVAIQRPTNLSPLTREAWGSGKVRVTVGGEAKGGSVKVGYEIGCQVNFGGGAGVGAGIGASVTPSEIISGNPGNPFSGNEDPAKGTAEVTLGPGGVSQLWLLGNNIQSSDKSNSADDDYYASSYAFKGKTGGVAYSQEPFALNGCAGYAAARTIVAVTVTTDTVKGVVVYTGKQFSLG